MNSAFVTSRRGVWAGEQQIGYLMQQGVDFPNCLSLAAGLVDSATLPVEIVDTITQQILADPSVARQALQYGTTAGSLRFRSTLIDHFAQLEGQSVAQLDLTPERCLVTTGSQQFLDLVTHAVFDAGDICLVTAPTYFVYLSTLQAAGVEPVPVACDEQGILPAALNETLETYAQRGELSRIKMLYLVTYFDNPRGTTLPEQRRIEVLEILQRWGDRQHMYLLEDAAYREMWFDSPPPASCYALDPSRERVIFTQTFSKSLSPGLRTGWGILPESLVKPVTDLKSVHDFGSPLFSQIVINRLIEQGLYQSHVAELRASYRHKCDVMWGALKDHVLNLPGMSATQPAGGLYVWLTIPDKISSRCESPLFKHCAETEQVMFVPGELFYADRSDPAAGNTMRLSFGVQSPENLSEGIQRLARGLRHFL